MTEKKKYKVVSETTKQYKAVAFITEYAHATVNSIAVACGGTTSYAYKIRKQYFICPFTDSETVFKEWTSYGKHKAEIDAGVDGEWYKSIKGLSKKEFERKAADFKAKFPTLVPTIAPAHFMRQPVPTDLKELPVYTTDEVDTANISDFTYNLTKGSKLPEKGTYTRSSVLDTAKQYVTKDRDATHGNMEDNFQTIADLWSNYLGISDDIELTPTDVAVMMTLLKIARVKSNPVNADNWIDACGYMACGGELATQKDHK